MIDFAFIILKIEKNPSGKSLNAKLTSGLEGESVQTLLLVLKGNEMCTCCNKSKYRISSGKASHFPLFSPLPFFAGVFHRLKSSVF